MFQFKKKKTEDTPIEELPPSEGTAADSLRTDDGGYLGPGAVRDPPADGDKGLKRKNYQRPENTDPPRKEAGPVVWVEHNDSASTVSSVSLADSNVKRAKCCNPDYGCCGGCCYPYTFFGFNTNQTLVMMAIGLFVTLGGLIIGLVVIFTGARPRKLCTTPECIVAAGEIIRGMDQTVNPCGDFVDFACGGWMRQHPVPAGMIGWDSFSWVSETTLFRIKELLEAPRSHSDISAVNITKTFYKACTNNSAWSAAGVTPLVGEINTNMGGFPMINGSWQNATFDWQRSVVNMRRLYAADYLLSVGVSYDAKNSSQYLVHIGEGSLPTPRDYLLSNNTRFKMIELHRITTIAKELMKARVPPSPSPGNSSRLRQAPEFSDNNSTLEEILKASKHIKQMQVTRRESSITLDGIAPVLNNADAKEVMQQEEDQHKLKQPPTVRLSTSQLDTDRTALYVFLRDLASLTYTTAQGGDLYLQYNSMTVGQLQNRTDALGGAAVKINWLQYINSVFSEVNITLSSEDRVIVIHPSYIDNLLKLLNKTPSRVVANFLSYMLALNLGEETSTSFIGLRSAKNGASFTRNIGRTDIRPWHDCSAKANMLLSGAVSYAYLTSSFSQDTLVKTREMVSDVHASFRMLIQKASWMDEPTRVAALLKVDKMIELVGYGKYATDAKYLDNLYQQLPPLSDTKHFDNILRLAHFLSKKSLALLNETPKKDVFSMNPVTINAAYSFAQNAMLIPAGILQPPFYRSNTITALNYGAIGIVIGHEISHGFDDAGKEIDHDGNLKQWWTNSANKTYHEKAQCFVEQYSQYPLPEDLKGDKQQLQGMKVDGVVTQGENIADNGGIQAAWQAYQKRIKVSGEDSRLPGLEQFSDDQLFFISFAQMWCTSYTPQGLRAAIALGPHSPSPYRVKGCYANTDQMRAAFRCDKPTSAGFNKTCRLW